MACVPEMNDLCVIQVITRSKKAKFNCKIGIKHRNEAISWISRIN